MKTRGKRTRQLLARLYEAFHFDLELTGPVFFDLKYLLRNSKYCAEVEVTPWSFQSWDDAPLVSWHRIPRFVRSQLEIQKLMKPNQGDIPLFPALELLLLSKDDFITPLTATPSLIQWQCPDTHRTHFVLIFLKDNIAMPEEKYTIGELLQIRDSMIPEPLPTMVERDLATSSGKAKPETEEEQTKGRSGLKRPEVKPKTVVEANNSTKKAMESSSTGSDEIVYKGNPSRRTGPVEPEWKYRGRSGSEATNEPLSAPAGLRAQQSEGFQRFYKAVVSPTHVRVTAGGRIVPNTRGTSSPTVKRVKDKPIDVQHETTQPTIQNQPDGVAAGKGPGVPVFAMPPQFYAPFGAALPHLNAGMQMMPITMGLGIPGAFPYAHPALNGAFSNATANGEKATKENVSKKADDDQDKSVVDEATGADKGESSAKPSSAEQPDQAKPFMFNGQLMYPMPSGFSAQMASPFMAPGFLGPHGYPLQQYAMPMMGTPPFGPSPMPVPMGGFGNVPPPATTQKNTSTANSARNASTASAPLTAPPAPMRQPPSNPPISSIRPSEISRKQIETLRSSLKYHEDQLQYNKHQIDEKEMEKTIRMLSQEIQRFEGVHQMQLANEEKNYPKREKSNDGMSQAGSQTVGLGQALKLDENKVDSDSQGGSRHGSQRGGRGLRFRPSLNNTSHGLNSGQSNDAAFRLEKLDHSAQACEPVRKSSLPSRAALAPPFQPRGKSAFGTNPSLADGLHGIESSSSAVDKHLMPTGMDNWGGWLTSPANGFLDGPGSTEADQPVLGRPYLVGVLPDHVDPRTARDADYVYGRELTDKELRARFLYWGRAPMSVRQGLPKYDGKHFYPPSPVIESTSQGHQNTGISVETPSLATAVDPFQPTTPTNGIQAAKMLASKENTPPKQAEDTSSNGPIRAKAVSEVVDCSDKGFGAKAGNKIISNMLKRGITRSTDVLPSEVSATTAQGYLPQYTSFGTLAHSQDATTGSSETPGDVSPSKSSDGGGVLLSPVTKKAAESRSAAANPGASLEEQFRNIVSNDTKNRAGLPAHWKN